MGELNELIYVCICIKHLEQCMTHGKLYLGVVAADVFIIFLMI